MSRIKIDDVAVMSVQYVQHSFPYYLKSMKECGLKNIDMWGGAPHYCRMDYNSSMEAAAKIRELKNQMDAYDMQVVIYTPETLGYPFSYSTDQAPLRARTIDYMKYAMEDALAFGTDRVFLNTGCHPRDLDREEGFKRCIDSYQKLCACAEKMGIRLMLEQLQPYESNLCINIEDMKRMIKEVDSPAMNVCVDLVAMEVAGENLPQYFEAFKDKIQWIHYSDSHHLILGDGDYGKEKLKGYIDTLEKYNYTSYLDLEINDSIYWEDPHDSVKKSVAYLKTIL